MDTTLNSTFLEFNRSTLVLSLRQHESGTTYVEMEQNIEGHFSAHILKINCSILPELITILQRYQQETTEKPEKQTVVFIKSEARQTLIDRYLKGVTINDLAMQYDCERSQIEKILLDNGYPIVDNRFPVQMFQNWRRNRKRK